MAAINVVTLSGNLGGKSRTRALIDAVADRIGDRADIRRTDINVGDLAPELGALVNPAAIPPKVAEVIAAIVAADLLVVGSPVYKGSYTGLFKHLIDFIDPNALIGAPVVLTATGGAARHALVTLRLHAAEALQEKAGLAVDRAVADPTAETVAAAQIAVAEAKILSTEIALEASNALFELAGTRSTLAENNLDRHWRNARVHTLHDPVRWKYAIVGNYALNGVNPPLHAWS